MPLNYRILPKVILTGLIGMAITLLLLVHYGRVQLASLSLVLLSWAAMTLLAIDADGIRDIAVIAYIVVIFIAALLLEWHFALFITLLSIASLWSMAILESKHILDPSLDNEYNYSRDFTAILVLIASLIFLYSRSLKISLEKVKSELHERKQAEIKLKESEHAYRSLFEKSPLGVVTVSLSGDFTDVNEKFCLLTGYPREQIIGKNAMEIGLVDFLFKQKMKKEFVLKNGSLDNFEYVFRNREGKFLHFILAASIIKIKEEPFIIVMLQDITERRRVEKALRLSEKKFIKAFRLSPMVIIISESDTGILTEVNETFVTLSGWTREEVLGKSIRDLGLWVSTDQRDYMIQQISQRKVVKGVESAFLQNMSHEVRSPMNAIIGFSELLAEPEVSREEVSRYADVIITSSRQLLSVVTDILTISSIETGQETVNYSGVPINSLLEELAIMFKLQLKSKDLILEIKPALADDKATLITDETKLTQILSNLINNAIKFTPKGRIEVGYLPAASDIQFYVKDTGIGIDPEMQEKIFDRFKQADDSINKKYGGTGLGLAISKAHTELLGGKIWVESKPGKGSLFCFTLPYTPADTEIKGPAKEEPAVELPRRKIMVVEDEDFNFHYIREILAKKGMTIIRAKNGREAVEICTADLTIDLVLMDIKMPEMNGFDALKIIKKHRPGLPLIGQTAYAFPQEKTRALESGFDDYITKPIKLEVLLDALAKVMD